MSATPRLPPAFFRTAALSSLAAAMSVLLSAAPALAAHKPRPDLTIPLQPLGFGKVAAGYLAAGQTMFTVNFVDNAHLLLTFNTTGLLPRLPDAEAEDEDRNVAALLLELPGGKVVARTTWRTRDHGRYLWALGNGHFLLRSRNRFSLVSPVRNLAHGDAFQQHNLLTFKRRIALVDVSPDGGLLMVETAPPLKPPLLGAAASAAALAATVPGADSKPTLQVRTEPPPEYELRFFRLNTADDSPGASAIAVQSAGGVRARDPVEIAMTPLGYLAVNKESSRVYDFDFHSFRGKKLELSPYQTSCPPHAMFTSLTDFIAFGCHGGTERNELSAFNLRGEEPWISILSGTQAATFLQSSPASGRFALSLSEGPPVSVPGAPDDGLPTSTAEVEVVQHHDGRVLLTTSTSPIQVAGQSFDLSPDGTLLAVMQLGQIAVYQLPPLSRADKKAMSLSASAFTESPDGPVQFEAFTEDGERSPHTQPESEATAAESAPEATPTARPAAPPVAVPATPAANAPAGTTAAVSSAPAAPSPAPGSAAQTSSASGDAQPEHHRKPPSLYDADHPKPPSQ